MIDCAYCERPLICDNCQAPYVPASEEHYQALAQSDVALGCAVCGTVLVCHWCKTPYDGILEEDEPDQSSGP